MFYVPGLLPPVSPRRQQEFPNKFTLSESSAKESVVQKKMHQQADDNEETKKVPSHAASERTGESVAQLQMTATENDEPPDITPSQAANVEMLLELAGEDDMLNVSMGSQQMITTSGFCIDEQEEEDMVKCYTHMCTFTLLITFAQAFVFCGPSKPLMKFCEAANLGPRPSPLPKMRLQWSLPFRGM